MDDAGDDIGAVDEVATGHRRCRTRSHHSRDRWADVGECVAAAGARDGRFGVGSIRGTVLGLILIQIVIKGTALVVRGIDPSQIEGLVLGTVVVLAVALNGRVRGRECPSQVAWRGCDRVELMESVSPTAG